MNNDELIDDKSNFFSVDELNLSKRTKNVLKSENIFYLNQLRNWCEHALLKANGLGLNSFSEIKNELIEKNIILGSLPYKNQHEKCFSCRKIDDLLVKSIEVYISDNEKKIHLSYWRGFNLATELIFTVLDNSEFDFTGCTNSNQVCDLIKEAIETEISYLKRGD